MSYSLRMVLAGTALLGAVSGIVGSFAVLRRRALMGDVFAHTALPGMCLAFLFVGSLTFWPMLAGALLTGLLGAGVITLVTHGTRTKEDAAIGIVLSTFFGAGIVLSSRIQRMTNLGSPAGLESYIYGQAATLTWTDIVGISIVSAGVLLTLTLFYKEFKLISFDAPFAQALGWPTARLDLLLMGLIAMITVAGLPAVGVVLMAALLITPAAAARLWCEQLGNMLCCAGIFGAGAGVLGTLLSQADWGPPGPLIVLAASGWFVISLVIAPRRGLASQALARFRLRRDFDEHHLLRALFELGEAQPDARPPLPVTALQSSQGWTARHTSSTLGRAARRGLVEIGSGAARLSPQGLQQALAVTRSHRLWELYWLQRDPNDWQEADRAADSIEHLLSSEAVARLEAELAAAGRIVPGQGSLPASPHELPSVPGEPAAEAPP